MEITDDMDTTDDVSGTWYIEPVIFTSLVSFFSLTVWSLLNPSPAKALEGRVAVSTSPLPSFFPKKKKNQPEPPPPPLLTIQEPTPTPLNAPAVDDNRFLLTCTENQKNIIQNIATVVSTSDSVLALTSLAFDKGKIMDVHPFCFLHAIFSEKTIAYQMKKLPHRTNVTIGFFFKKDLFDSFLGGVREGLLNFREDIEAHIIPFAKALGVDSDRVTSCLQEDDGAKALVTYLIQTLPR